MGFDYKLLSIFLCKGTLYSLQYCTFNLCIEIRKFF